MTRDEIIQNVKRNSFILQQKTAAQLLVGSLQGLEKSVLQIKWTYSRILAFFWEKINKMDKTESYIFNADNAELGNFLKKEKKLRNRIRLLKNGIKPLKKRN